MNFDLQSYTIRRKVLKLFGGSFHIFDPNGNIVGFSSQKAFKLKEDIRVFSDESMQREVLSIRARQIVDFSAGYDIVDTEAGRKIGSARRKGFSSMFRDSWEIMDENDRLLGKLQEDSAGMAVLRRLLSNLIPQKFHLDVSGQRAADFRVHFNPFVYRMTIERNPQAKIDSRLVVATGVLLAAIEGRQQ